MIPAFEASASFGQICILRKGAAKLPYWLEAHLAQGFAACEGAVSFGLPEHEGSLWIETEIVEAVAPWPRAALRAIQVPFSFDSTGASIATSEGDLDVLVPEIVTAVRFVLLPGMAVRGNWMSYTVLLQFLIGANGSAELLRRDGAMTAEQLLMTAEEPERQGG